MHARAQRRRLVLGLLAGAALVAASAWYASRESPDEVVAAPPASRPDVAEALAQGGDHAGARLEPAPARARTTASDPAAPAILRGRFLLPDGRPAEGVKLLLARADRRRSSAARRDDPPPWTELHEVSDADGSFEFRFGLQQAEKLELTAHSDGCAELLWRWKSLEPASTTDVRRVRLQRGASVHGRIVDAQGLPVPLAWTVHAEPTAKPLGRGRERVELSAPSHPATGEYCVEGLPSGYVRVRAFSNMTGRIDGGGARLHEGEAVRHDIVYDGPDQSRRIVILVRNRALLGYQNPEFGTLLLLGDGGFECQAKRLSATPPSWSFEDVDPGAYVLRVSDPRYRTVQLNGVQPGHEYAIDLVGSSSLSIRVVDDATEQPVEPHDLDVGFQSRGWFVLRSSAESPAPDGLYEGLVQGSLRLRASAPGYEESTVDVLDLAPGETRAVVLRLGRP
jgi:hypothetical protein